MEKTEENRAEQRLVLDGRVWFSDDVADSRAGLMMDISSQAMAFCCEADENCPWPGKQITARFDVPRLGFSPFQSKVTFNRKCKVFRIENISESFCKVVVSFDRPLFFKPAEQGFSESETKQRLEAMV
ncbi:MAG TPA: hypothetical protein PLP05_11125 [Sedimentisphaerales bacterium]|nr:hypothetical protein [Sedimentisphaerales bacterium]